MTTFYLARHGRTVWHAENRYAGRSDIALDDEGCRQAEALGRWAAQAELATIVCSPLLRARATAAPAARATGLEPLVEPRLTECDFGIAEGRTLAALRVAEPEAAAAFERDPAANPWPGGEEPSSAADRAITALNAIARSTDDPVLVVAHNTLLRLALCQMLGIPLGDYRRRLPGLRNVAISEIRLGDGAGALVSLNVPLSLSKGS